DLLELSDFPDPVQQKLIQIILMERYLLITIKGEKQTKSYPIYLLHLYHEKAACQIERYDLKTAKREIFPVSKLTDVKPYSPKREISKSKIMNKISKEEEVINLILELGPKGIAQFKKYHPLKFSISYTNPYQTTAILKSFINVQDPEEV